MKPAVVAQDEMFPDGDAGWMEMDEVYINGASILHYIYLLLFCQMKMSQR